MNRKYFAIALIALIAGVLTNSTGSSGATLQAVGVLDKVGSSIDKDGVITLVDVITPNQLGSSIELCDGIGAPNLSQNSLTANDVQEGVEGHGIVLLLSNTGGLGQPLPATRGKPDPALVSGSIPVTSGLPLSIAQSGKLESVTLSGGIDIQEGANEGLVHKSATPALNNLDAISGKLTSSLVNKALPRLED